MSPQTPEITYDSLLESQNDDASSSTLDAHKKPAVGHCAGVGDDERPRSHWVLSWLLEITAALFSVICIALMVALLLAIDAKPYRKWRIAHVNITPNALLSVLSAFSKSSLLLLLAEGIGQLKWIYFQQRPHRLLDLQVFDEASRGPLGAFRLIISVRLTAIIAVLGGFITILAIAVDPFTQQILSFPTSMVNTTSAATGIATTRVIGASGTNYTPPSWYTSQYWLNQMEAAILAGMMGEIQPAHYSCPSGDCTWPQFTTLGFCSRCADVSDKVVVTNVTHGTSYTKIASSKYVTYSLPAQNELKIAGINFTLEWINWNEVQILPYTDPLAVAWSDGWGLTANSSFGTDGTNSFGTNIAAVQTMQFKQSYVWNRTTWDFIGDVIRPQALHCSFTFCSQTHTRTRYSGGELHDPVTSTQNLVVSGWTQVNLSNNLPDLLLPAWPVGQQKPAKYSFGSLRMSERNDTYWIGTNDVWWFLSSLSSYLGNTLAYSMSSTIKTAALQASQHLDGIGNLDTITPMMDDIALSLTNRVRSLNTSSMVQGTSKEAATFVMVHWYWLIYPAALVVLSILFFIMTVLFSNDSEGVLWKTSMLPFLYHGLQAKGQIPKGASLRDMKRAANREIAVLQHNGPQGIALASEHGPHGD